MNKEVTTELFAWMSLPLFFLSLISLAYVFVIEYILEIPEAISYLPVIIVMSSFCGALWALKRMNESEVKHGNQ